VDLPLAPRNREHARLLLDAWLLEKAMYEVPYEIDNRPAWLPIPLRGVLNILSRG